MLLDCQIPSGGWSCCTSTNQCGIGEGDCDTDSHCSGNLKCGTDNCDTTLGFSPTYDCCYDPATTQGNKEIISPFINVCLTWNLTVVIILGSGCNSGSGGWSCCSSSNQCSSGEGDCDNDSHCSGVLKCGTDNCGPNFPTGFDCCILPTIVG